MSDSEFAWATVYSSNPVTVRRDGETEPIGVTPQTVVPLAMLSVKDRVWCQFVNRRALILGKAGGAWPSVARGRVEISVTANTVSSVAITFPAGQFSATPEIVVSAKTSGPGVVQEVTYQNDSKNGFTAYIMRTSSTNTSISWIAVGV